MSLLNLQEIDHHLYHHHHHHHQNRTDEHDPMESGGSTSIRSYDCVFCQRGFTTAQALGGHMNIHRKDRANPSTIKHNNSPAKEPTIITNKEILFEEDYDDDQFSVANTRLLYSNNRSYLSSQNQGYDGGSSSFEGQVHRFMGSEKWADSNPSSRVVSSHNNNINNNNNNNNNMIGKRVQDDGHSMEGEEIDLELRLGHYSW